MQDSPNAGVQPLSRPKEMLLGFVIGLAAAAFCTVGGAAFVGAAVIVAVGVVQLVVQIPLLITLGVKKRWWMFQGVLLAAIIVFLVNAGCWAFVVASLSH